MAHLSAEAREAIIQQALNRRGKVLKEIAQNNNVGYSTLQRWLRNYHAQTASGVLPSPGKLNRSEQFKHIVATEGLDEIALGIYCRQQGLYSSQLQVWKEAFMKDSSNKAPALHKELKALRAENKRLKKDLDRKDKALSETSALLVLKKKADLILGGKTRTD